VPSALPAARYTSLGLALALLAPWSGAAAGALAPPRAKAASAAATKAGKQGESAPSTAEEDDLAARRLLKRAQDLLLARESERAVKMLETIADQYPNSPVRFEAWLALGKHYLEAHDQAAAIAALRRLNDLKKPDEELSGAAKELYLEGLYLTGVAYFQTRQYAAAFPILRKITANYPNTLWANQAYHHIGLCHFAQGNWNKAIQALSLVGTFVDPNSPAVEYAEAGRRFFVKVQDTDLPILHRLGKPIQVQLSTTHGDKETIPCTPLAPDQGIFITSIPTDLASPKPGDGTLQVTGGDSITATYLDENTQEGHRGVPRERIVRVVSTAQLRFTLGTYESRANAAFLGQPLTVLLQDADHDTSPQADTVTLRILSRYREAGDQPAPAESLGAAVAAAAIAGADEDARPVVRDEVVLTLTELGEPPVHTGRFGATVSIQPTREGQPIDKADQALSCAVGDEIVATYIDDLHIAGATPREVTAQLRVVGEIDSRPRATQNVVPDPLLKTKKELVEATAYLELAKIFKSMGLTQGAKEKSNQGIERVDAILSLETPIPSALREEAFKLKWELYIAQDDFPNAIATCRLFHRLYPNSPFVDQALMGIAAIRVDQNDLPQAMAVYRQILALPHSQAKAEAQFRLAQCLEAQAAAAPRREGAPTGPSEAAIQQYKLCADRYPDSPFAGQALAKLVDYHVETKDYARAEDLLTQIFQDYPDGDFLDSMLLKWVIVAYRMNDMPKAYNKCSQLLFEYPASPHAAKAKEILPRIEAKIKGAAEETDEKKAD